MASKYHVTGMTCAGCARSVETAIKMEAPGATVAVDLGTATVTVDGASEAQVKKAVGEAGFTFLGAA
ncbi:MAG: heavy-metal-associated domain-containing protein [Magnetospirillum sp.]|nr:heavy-metal-associated domain-containing protein [Magnetospirillum sp.]